MADRFILFVILCTLAGSPVRSQCPDPATVNQQIAASKTLPYDQWLSAFSRLKQQREQCRAANDSNYASILFLLSYAYSIQENYEKAVQLTRASIRIDEKKASSSAPIHLPQTYYFLGQYLRALNQSAEAMAAYQRSIDLGSKLATQQLTVSQSLNEQAYILTEQGDYGKALDKAESSYRLATNLNNQLLVAACLVEIARNQFALGKLTDAERTAKAAIELTVELAVSDPYGADLENTSRLILAYTYRAQNRIPEALRQYEYTIAAYQKTGKQDEIAVAYNNAGYLYLTNHDYNKAQQYLEKAYPILRDKSEKAVCLNNIGMVYEARGQYAKALVYLQQALTLMPIGFRSTDVSQNPPAEALRLLTKEENLLSLIQDKADTWLQYAKATHNRQRFQYALNTYQIADEMIDLMRWQHTGQQSKLVWRKKTRGMYERAIEACHRLGDMEQAFRFLEKSRAVLLADKLNELGARQQLPPQQAAEEQRLRESVSRQQSRLADLSADSVAYAKARAALQPKQDSLDQFLKKLDQSNTVYNRNKYDNATSSLADLQDYLRAHDASFLTYFVGDSALYVLGVTGTKATLLQQKIKPYNQTVQAFMPLLGNADAMNRKTSVEKFWALGNGLYRQLLAPLALPAGRVIVSSDGFFIPFETLSRSADKPDYLVADYAFSYAYSVRLLLKNGGAKSAFRRFRGRDFLGIAPVTFAPALKQVTLAGSDAALKPIASHFGSSELLTHQAATRQAFLKQAINARVVHLFTHAIADSSGREPLLYFADSTLRLSDLNDESLPNAQMVVLAACQTGIGANQRGEGVFSLARGFAALGAPSVLTTLWSVDNNATYKLSDLFYQHLAEGLPKDLALQRAKQDWLKSAEGANQLPTYWAGFIVVGDTEPIGGTDWLRWLMVMAMVAVVGLSGWWFWRSRKPVTKLSSPRSV
jgi:CHAT domain-containing protein